VARRHRADSPTSFIGGSFAAKTYTERDGLAQIVSIPFTKVLTAQSGPELSAAASAG